MKEKTYLFHGPWEWPPPGGDVDECDVAGSQPRVGSKGDGGRSRGGMDCGTRGGRWGRGVGRRHCEATTRNLYTVVDFYHVTERVFLLLSFFTLVSAYKVRP
jgi:hypothetical protein